ncbi:MAG: LysM peptidoglycan-binding domain-containing protein [Bacteroidota bacterium]
MRKQLLLLGICGLFCFNTMTGLAQDSLNIKIEDMPKRLLPYTKSTALSPSKKEPQKNLQPATQQLDSFQKDVMSRISDVYRIQVLALEAQVNDDPIVAEDHINNAVQATQELLEDYPEISNDRRFAELYRSVISEYREFYGITDAENEPQGEIFGILDELFGGEDEFANVTFDFPENAVIKETQVPLITNPQVNRHLVYYTLRRPEVMETWLQRAEVYKPMMLEIFKEEGLPEELVHLAYIESGLNPTARSWASAVGMWQFIRATGSVYGLESNWWIDERRDPEKATRAAARHLKDLYNIWGDWHLAMANYNISPRGLKRAIRRAGGVEDYWAAYPYLPRETRGYVPGFIAATMIAMNPTEFGFEKKYEGEPYQYDVFEVDGLMQLEDLAKAAGIALEELKEYNPELLRWATPPGNKYPLKLPKGVKGVLARNYDSIPKENRSENITMHTVRKGESIGLIARKYGTTVSAIFANNDKLSKTIYPGQNIIVPLPKGSKSKIAANRPTNQQRTVNRSRTTRVTAPANSEKLTYVVKTGDTIGHIAEWYDVRAWQIRTWSGVGNTIRVGQKLTVYVPKSQKEHFAQINTMSFQEKQNLERRQKRGENIVMASSSSTQGSYVTYTVKKNDTLSEIAESHGIRLSELRSLNNIRGNRIFVGQTLKIKSNTP